jgi:hypothetical protein
MECPLCNYTAKTKGNYQRHCKTAKHILKENDIKGFDKTRNTPEKIVKELKATNKQHKEYYEIKEKQLIEKHEQELKEKDSIIKAYQSGIVARYNILHKKLMELEIIDHYDNILVTENETKSLKEQNKRLREHLVASMDISGNLINKRWN